MALLLARAIRYPLAELLQDPDNDRYLFPSDKSLTARQMTWNSVGKTFGEPITANASIRTDLKPIKRETKPLAKIWCVRMEDDAHQPDELNSQLSPAKHT